MVSKWKVWIAKLWNFFSQALSSSTWKWRKNLPWVTSYMTFFSKTPSTSTAATPPPVQNWDQERIHLVQIPPIPSVQTSGWRRTAGARSLLSPPPLPLLLLLRDYARTQPRADRQFSTPFVVHQSKSCAQDPCSDGDSDTNRPGRTRILGPVRSRDPTLGDLSVPPPSAADFHLHFPVLFPVWLVKICSCVSAADGGCWGGGGGETGQRGQAGAAVVSIMGRRRSGGSWCGWSGAE